MSGSLGGRQVAFLVAPDGVEQVELTEPWRAVAKAGGLLDFQADPGSVFIYRREPRAVAADRPYLRGCTVKFDARAIPRVRGQALIPANASPDRETRMKLRAQSGALLGDCVKIGYVSGRDDEVKAASHNELMHFLTSQLKSAD